MDEVEYDNGLSDCIYRAIQEHLAKSSGNIAWPQIDGLKNPTLRIEAFLEEAGSNDAGSVKPGRIASVCTLSCSSS